MSIVGVGSVGTRCYLLLLIAADRTPLILQIKQAGRSVIDQYGHRQQPDTLTAAEQALGCGARVVAGQRTLQGMPDVFLGALRTSSHDYYLRRYQHAKGSIDPAAMSPTILGHYAGACASALARAHAQSPNAAMWGGYIGTGNTFSAAILDWSYAYADKTLQDYHQLQAAATAGDIDVAANPMR